MVPSLLFDSISKGEEDFRSVCPLPTVPERLSEGGGGGGGGGGGETYGDYTH